MRRNPVLAVIALMLASGFTTSGTKGAEARTLRTLELEIVATELLFPEECGDCEYEIDDGPFVFYCPNSPPLNAEDPWPFKHRFWSQTQYGDYQWGHSQWACGSCGENHDECTNHELEEELAAALEPGGDLRGLIKRYPEDILIDPEGAKIMLLNCSRSRVAKHWTLSERQRSAVSDFAQSKF